MKPSMACSDAGYGFGHDALAKYLAASLQNPNTPASCPVTPARVTPWLPSYTPEVSQHRTMLDSDRIGGQGHILTSSS